MTIGSILREAFGFMKTHAIAIAAWCALNIALQMALQAVMRLAFRAPNSFGVMAPGAPPPLWALLLAAPGIILLLMLWTAALRARFHPADDRAAYLRLGEDEMRQLGLFLLFSAGLIVLWVAVILVIVIVVAVAKGAGAIVAIVLALGGIGFIIFAGVRLSLAAPLTMRERRITLGKAWRLSRGRFLTLFGAHVVIWLIALLALMPLFAVQLGPIWSDMKNPTMPGAAEHLAAFRTAQFAGPLSVRAILLAIVAGVLNVLTIALSAATASAATVQLLGLSDDATPDNQDRYA